MRGTSFAFYFHNISRIAQYNNTFISFLAAVFIDIGYLFRRNKLSYVLLFRHRSNMQVSLCLLMSFHLRFLLYRRNVTIKQMLSNQKTEFIPFLLNNSSQWWYQVKEKIETVYFQFDLRINTQSSSSCFPLFSNQICDVKSQGDEVEIKSPASNTLDQLIKLKINQFKQLAMLPVKSNNHQPKNTRAQSRKKRNQTVNAKGQVGTKTNKSKKKNKDDSICANQLSDSSSTGEPTMHTGFINRKGNQIQDTKTTLKKINFENKPIIKDLAKRINSFSKQYAPEYFTNILEYMIEKEIKATMSPTVQKINKWRVYIDRQRQIEAQVRMQFLKLTSRIITGRKKLRQEMRRQNRIKQIYDEYQSVCYENNGPLNSERFPYPEQYKSESQQSSHSSVANASCPQLCKPMNQYRSEVLTQQSLTKQWECRYDKFTYLIQTILQHLGTQQCSTTMYPTCYIFYAMAVADSRVFSFLKPDQKSSHYSQPSVSWISSSRSAHKAHSREPTPADMVDYYLIASILIATKYHEIYPASLVDLIDCVNYQLEFEYAIRIEGQILEMLNFTEFFTDNQYKYLKMFTTIIGWTSTEQNVCDFILQSGLNNPNLYTYSPLYKAAVVVGIYEEHLLQSQEKFMMIKSLCPGLSFDLMTKIKKNYLQAVVYNNKNKITSHKRKFFIFENEMRKIIKDNS